MPDAAQSMTIRLTNAPELAPSMLLVMSPLPPLPWILFSGTFQLCPSSAPGLVIHGKLYVQTYCVSFVNPRIERCALSIFFLFIARVGCGMNCCLIFFQDACDLYSLKTRVFHHLIKSG